MSFYLNTMINFKAAPINRIAIQKYDNNNNFKNHNVSFVEIDPHSAKDINSIGIIGRDWEDGNSYAGNIADRLKNDFIVDNDNPKRRIFALTRQFADFGNLRDYDILGLVQMFKRDYDDTGKKVDFYEIEYLQTNPEYNYENPNRYFKHIGTAILNSIKSIYSGKTLIVNPVNSKIPFYEKNGFVKFAPRFWHLKA